MAEAVSVFCFRVVVVALARIWKNDYAPVSHVESVFVDGDWVKVTVDFDKEKGARKPARRADDPKEN